MNIEREWLATIALNLVDSYNYSTRRALDKLTEDYNIDDQAIRATINALISETIRRKNIIDRLANAVLDKSFQNKQNPYPSLKRLDAKVKNFLRIMIYRMKFESHPSELIINTSKTILSKKYSDITNTFVLWLDMIISIDINDLIASLEDPVDRLALQTWEPYFLVKRFYEVYQDKAHLILEYFKKNSPIFVRINNLKDKTVAFKEFDQYNVELEKDTYMPDVYKVLKSDVPMARLNGFKKGYFYIQSRSSALIAHLLNPQEGETILDTCSAPGSKTTHIASLTNDLAKITALEIDTNRIEMLKKTVERCGVKSIRIVSADARKPPIAPNQKFDKILLDAPCSGSGTLSTKTHAKWRIKNSLIKKYAKLQLEILEGVAPYVKEGGLLLYSTCSLLPEENEEVIKEFLTHNPSFSSVALLFPDLGESLSYQGKRLLPHVVDSEGFSIFLIQRTEK